MLFGLGLVSLSASSVVSSSVLSFVALSPSGGIRISDTRDAILLFLVAVSCFLLCCLVALFWSGGRPPCWSFRLFCAFQLMARLAMLPAIADADLRWSWSWTWLIVLVGEETVGIECTTSHQHR